MDCIKRIQTDHEYEEAIAEVQFLWDTIPGTPDHLLPRVHFSRFVLG